MNMVSHNALALSAELYQQEFNYYDQLHQEKYRDEGQSQIEHQRTIAKNLSSNWAHQDHLLRSLSQNRFLPAGRIQAALGATQREVSPFNCSVSQRIDDSMDSIMAACGNAAKILRLGTGIGYNFSNLRPKGALISKLKTQSSGPLSFMKIFDVMASTIASSGHRRGAQMGILNVDHPDIEDFIDAKMEKGAYRQFNLSVGITDEFMAAVERNANYKLSFGGSIYKEVSARQLWEKITKNAYHSAEPGIIFLDRLNDQNNLHYCEQIEATNPCAEQPLPPYGLCTLGSFSLVGYIQHDQWGKRYFNYKLFREDIHNWVEAYDNIFDNAIYAIPEHKQEALNKRRIGLGFTGIANAIEYLLEEACYGSEEFCHVLDDMSNTLKEEAYRASVRLAKERGSFPLYSEKYCDSKFVKSLSPEIQKLISEHGIRNSHLVSYAPCGTISQCAGNVSSGVEPVFHHEMKRDVYMKEGKINVTLNDYNFRQYGFRGKTLEECSVEDHMRVAETVQRHCDSSISKTVNVSSNCSYEDYAKIYIEAHKLGLKGITVYRPSEVRGIVIQSAKKEVKNEKPIQGDTVFPSSCANGMCSM
jgi:ribonucleoside-diphosphate reductase alpha chain